MAAKASGGRTLEFIGRGVTLGANHAGMCACQSVYRVVNKGGRFPGGSGVAAFARGAFRAGMHIILQMATHTGCRRALELAIDMALSALNCEMRANQLETNQVMVKAGRFPGGCGVTGSAIGAQTAVVSVLAQMAGNAG